MSDGEDQSRHTGEIKRLDEKAARDLRVISLEQNILEANEIVAAQNREVFETSVYDETGLAD